MKNTLLTELLRTKLLPSLLIIISLVFAGSVSFFLSAKSQALGVSPTKIQEKVTVTSQSHPTRMPTPFPTRKSVLSAITHNITPIPTKSLDRSTIPTLTTTPVTQNTTNAAVSQPMPTVIASSIPTLTPSVSPTKVPENVSLQIVTPDGNSSFSVILKNGATVCDVLQEAKDEGKINSVTLDDSYMSSLHSKYIYEINGYKNNWTFTVNGSSPLGCSLSNPKPNDTIVLKFG